MEGWVPRIETYRKDHEYVARIDLPGVDPKDVQVQVEGNVLSITGERKREEKGTDYQETFYGKFERAITLPHGVESDKIAAHYEHGVLEVRVPLPAQLVGRKIPVEIGQKESPKLESKAA
jgi:HSP20 family protein